MKRIIQIINDYKELTRFFSCIEDVEHYFDFEFSCGDGLFLSDIQDDYNLMEQYDGMVDFSTIRKDGQKYSGIFRFDFIYNDDPYDDDTYSKLKVYHHKGNRFIQI